MCFVVDREKRWRRIKKKRNGKRVKILICILKKIKKTKISENKNKNK